MSCDYDVYCLDCKAHHGFDDTNHAIKEMRALAKIGRELQAISMAWEATLAKIDMTYLFLEPRIIFREGWHWQLNTKFWIDHGSHRLVAIDEYGRTDDECDEKYQCPTCKQTKYCKRVKGHEPPHEDKRREGE